MQPRPTPRSVDGFLQPRGTRPLPHLQPRGGADKPASRLLRPHASAVTMQPRPTPTATEPTPTPLPRPVQQPVAEEPEEHVSFPKRLLLSLGKLMLGIGMLAFAFLVQSPAFGQLAILVYAAAALIWRISSRITFILAVMALGLVLLTSVRSDVELAGTFALYAFLLLIVGTISLWREVRSEI